MKLPTHIKIRYIASLVGDASEILDQNEVDCENGTQVKDTDGLCGRI